MSNKLPDTFTVRFDPVKSKLKCWEHPIGMILWICIACCHITDQNLDRKILKMAKEIDKSCPENYEQYKTIFKKFATHTNYGVKCKENSIWIPPTYEYDESFWTEVYDFIVGNRTLTIKYELGGIHAR